MNVLDEFAEKWLNPANPISQDCLSGLESTLGHSLPSFYKHILTKYGAGSCPWLLDNIVKNSVDLPDIQEFINPDELKETNEMYVSSGMNVGYFIFASDCMGNVFMFSKDDLTPPKEDCPVYFFDHDFDQISIVDNSLINLLKRYIAIPKTRDN